MNLDTYAFETNEGFLDYQFLVKDPKAESRK